jgi:hypothetical protein
MTGSAAGGHCSGDAAGEFGLTVHSPVPLRSSGFARIDAVGGMRVATLAVLTAALLATTVGAFSQTTKAPAPLVKFLHEHQ